ncbi:TPA: valine--tRNA ligase [bacterium]|nr:valine--tRNA ligase [bacterium]
MEIPRAYNPKETEKWYKFWEENGYFTPSDSTKPAYSIVIPPPNVTGSLHMGHALNNTVQDILARFKRMQGFNVLWLPGTDHAGIATQNVVEKMLLQNGIKREDIGREEFLKRVWEWKEEYGNKIIEQLKKLGCSCDWTRLRFTMDERCSLAVKEVFVRLYKEGLIYRDNYIINWCLRCQTAISDIEVDYKEEDGFLYYLKYPIKNETDFVVVATTRPETMLGDTAVAVNSEDYRYKNIIGKTAILPILNRELPIIADSFVKIDFGTGALKITPAHDANDFIIGKRHNLSQIKIFDEKGIMNEEAGPYKGFDRFEVREKIVDDLKNDELIEKIEPYKYSIGHCYRCRTIIEPYLSKQWFVRMKPLAEPAISVVSEKKVEFIPDNWKKTYLEWMENIKDWCISRQIWWGHRIPVWYCQGMLNQECRMQDGVIVSVDTPSVCPHCGFQELVQDDDVLDTWFSSALWPFSTMGWPKDSNDLKTFYPTSVLSTGFDIIFFWVARMIMMGLKFMNDVPFHKVYIHGLIRTDEGKKMSKSSGNIIDPIDVIERFGCDSLRFTLSSMLSAGRDILISEEKMESYRHFMNKLWNAGRFILMNLEEKTMKKIEPKTLAERWIFTRLSKVIDEVTKAIDNYSFNAASLSLYNFVWHEYCDWFLELEKEELKHRKEEVCSLLIESFSIILKLLHPFIPFITEELWSKFNKGSIMIEEWPKPSLYSLSWCVEAMERMERVKEIIIQIRSIKSIMGIPINKPVDVFIKREKPTFLDDEIRYLSKLGYVQNLTIDEKIERPKGTALIVVFGIEIYIMFLGIDTKKEKGRLIKRKNVVEKELEGIVNKLSNKEFLSKAPLSVVRKEKRKRYILLVEIEKIIGAISAIDESS